MIQTLLLAGNITGMGTSMFPPLGDLWSRSTYGKLPTKGIPFGDLINLRVKNRIDDGDFHKWSNEVGFEDGYADLLKLGQSQYLTGAEYVALWRRGFITEEACNKHLAHIGLQELDFELFKKVTEYFPLPGDLVRFAVREVYTPETVSKFGLMEDIPKKFLEEAWKGGLTEEQASNFWAAHWLLPSILQGYEMLHRDEITEEELGKLFVAADIMPFWRDKLQAISFSPLTRVDVRRMYRVGTLKAEDLPRRYQDVGYTKENADLLSDFTVKYESQDTVGYTRAAIVAAFKKRIIEEKELKELLEGLQYSPDVIQFWIDTAEWERAYEEITRDINELINEYRLGMKTKKQVQTALYEADLPATVISSTMQEIDNTSSLHVKMPPKADLERWLKTKIIEEQEYVSEMRLLGYQEKHIENYLTEIALEQDTVKRKYLGNAVYFRWLKTGIITQETFELTLGEKGVSQEDIANYLVQLEEPENES